MRASNRCLYLYKARNVIEITAGNVYIRCIRRTNSPPIPSNSQRRSEKRAMRVRITLEEVDHVPIYINMCASALLLYLNGGRDLSRRYTKTKLVCGALSLSLWPRSSWRTHSVLIAFAIELVRRPDGRALSQAGSLWRVPIVRQRRAPDAIKSTW